MQQRDAAKAAELTAAGWPASARTLRRLRLRYAEQGLWGLVDQRVTRPSDLVGKADPRLVAAIVAELDAQTHASTGTRGRLMRRVVAALTARHGEGVAASLLLARTLVPEPMRPGWAAALRMSVSRLPHARLLDVDARLETAAAKPVIVPETIVDHGRVFVSEVFTRACASLGISIQPARPGTPTDKAIVERTFSSINTLFCQHIAGYTGSNVTRRGDRVAEETVWSLPQLQDLLDE